LICGRQLSVAGYLTNNIPIGRISNLRLQSRNDKILFHTGRRKDERKKENQPTPPTMSSTDTSFELYDLRVEVVCPEGKRIMCGAREGDYFTLKGEMLYLPPDQGISIYSLCKFPHLFYSLHNPEQPPNVVDH
jgi:uncharacterized repeat protein (TIGR04076 family)